jgi:ABC transport system ATP-binding/permease protein
MKIVLVVEKSKSESAVERTFQKPLLVIGRDADNCDITFDNSDFRMVSRRHAEIRLQNGRYVLSDLGSSYGTFINGQKISGPQEITIGSSIQFGVDGPKTHVIWLEAEASASAPPVRNNQPPVSPPAAPPPAPPPHKITPKHSLPSFSDIDEDEKEEISGFISQFEVQPKAPEPPPSVTPSVPPRTPMPPPAKPAAPVAARLEFVDRPGTQAFTITKDSFWLGRDPQGDVVIEANAVMVSRRHAEIRRQNGNFILNDNKSFNGTLVNEQRISAPTPIYHDDRIQLGHGGPVLRFNLPEMQAPSGVDLAGQRSIAISQMEDVSGGKIGSGTMVFNLGNVSQNIKKAESEQKQLLMQIGFGNKNEIVIGRNESNDISLDGLQISNQHARLKKDNRGVVVEDLNSTNGVYINGKRISRQVITPADAVQIGSFVIQIDEYENILVFDTRSKTRIDSVGITKDVKNRAGRGKIRLLDDVSLSIRPNEFVGLIGPSGAGKSTFMDALNGMRPATSGTVLVNNLDLYRYIDSLKQSIGYVPQDDIIHRELTVYKTLFYVGKLRLSRDVSKAELNQIIEEVLDVTGLAERRDVPINQLSGGQRKRVSIAVELITKPSVIFLDEPTSGLDPATEEKIMKLFRQIAESGRTVILTTHAMENIRLFDKIVVLMRGKLVFYGEPEEALQQFGARNFKELFDKLEEPVKQQIGAEGEQNRFEITERVAENWKQKFRQTPQFKKNVYEPLREIKQVESGRVKKSHRLGIFGSIRQWITLTRRYARVLTKDKFNLFILFAQAPIIALLVFFVMGENQPRDFAYFALSLCAIWFGTSVAAREIVRERPIYERERMVNLGILPYVGSKLFVLGFIVFVQCFLLFIPLKFFDLTGLMPMPGMFLGMPQFAAMLVTAAVGVALGLFISSIVKTSEMATSLIPLILIPQIIFSGLIGVPGGINKVVGLAMPAAWSFDTMKRFSTLDTLEAEGALKNGESNGQGLYQSIEAKNDVIIEDTKKKIKDFEKELQDRLNAESKKAERGEKFDFLNLPERPAVADAVPIPDDLSRYVTFLHPWMNAYLNFFVLFAMFFMLFILTLLILRLQDIG